MDSLLVACPKCGAPSGSQCVRVKQFREYPVGSTMPHHTHIARVYAAREVQ